jgi:hypothetical protein
MKFTRRQLVELVKEEMAHPRGDMGKNIADVTFPIVVGYEEKSEIAYDQEELDNILDDIAPRGIAYSLDSLEDMEAKDVPMGASIEQMENFQLSKGSLKEMIKNSVRATILEQVVGYQPPEEEEKESDDYLTTGSTSIAAKSGSQEEEQAADTNTRELTQQRQQQLDKDDAVTADDTGRQLKDLLNQKNESKIKITKRQLQRIIRGSILTEQNRALEEYLVDELLADTLDSDDKDTGQIAKKELIQKGEGAGYRSADIEAALESLVGGGTIEIGGDDEELITRIK